MADNFSRKKRSSIMKAVKSRGNKSTEIKMIKIFRQLRIKGWRRHWKIIGNPDFVFPKKHIAVFTDGCFWHGHNCRNVKPRDNASYWKIKIRRNKLRDKAITRILKRNDWRVIRIWECEISANKVNNWFAK